MTKSYNPLAPRAHRLQVKSREIKAWVRQVLRLPDDTPVTVAELACRDEGCPDIETVIGVLETGKPIRTLRVHLPLADVKRNDIVDVLVYLSALETAWIKGTFWYFGLSPRRLEVLYGSTGSLKRRQFLLEKSYQVGFALAPPQEAKRSS